MVDLGLLPTKRTHKAKRSRAGKEEYYLTAEQIEAMIETAMTTKAKAMIAFFFNTACRMEGLLNARIENYHPDEHRIEIVDKGAITWDVRGLWDSTMNFLNKYLSERGAPSSGWLFGNGNGGENKLDSRAVNKMIREIGTRAGIEGKQLTSFMFRKSFVKYALDVVKINPVVLAGTGKEKKTGVCVGWTLDVVMKHYAPKMVATINEERQKFAF